MWIIYMSIYKMWSDKYDSWQLSALLLVRMQYHYLDKFVLLHSSYTYSAPPPSCAALKLAQCLHRLWFPCIAVLSGWKAHRVVWSCAFSDEIKENVLLLPSIFKVSGGVYLLEDWVSFGNEWRFVYFSGQFCISFCVHSIFFTFGLSISTSRALSSAHRCSSF